MRLLERAATISPRHLDPVSSTGQAPVSGQLKAGHVKHGTGLSAIASEVSNSLAENETAVRFVVTKSGRDGWECELGVIASHQGGDTSLVTAPLFEFRQRRFETQDSFNVVMVVPTGIGAEMGGHAGDATPAAIALAQVADTLITHPNVVNASDINELPGNGLYVEGSVLARLLMGTVGLRRVRANRVLVALDASYNERYAAYTVNAVNAARATYGLNCVGIEKIEPPLRLIGGYTATGRASGSVEGFVGLIELLRARRGTYDAVAVASVVEVPQHYHFDYFTSGGEMVNPWGGVEALLTHAVSSIMEVPTAHAPMMESDDIAAVDPGVVDARMAAEVISITFFQSVLKGLQRSPRIVTDESEFNHPDVMTAENVSCLVIPEGCLGLPTLAALHQGIPVIEVRENRNLMRNDLSTLPWKAGQFFSAENYWEATGIIAALKAGIDPHSVRRPIKTMRAKR